MTRINRPYVGIPSFLRSAVVEEIAELDAMVAVLGVPFDEGSPFLPGSRMGPRALREQSLALPGGPASTIWRPGRSICAPRSRVD